MATCEKQVKKDMTLAKEACAGCQFPKVSCVCKDIDCKACKKSICICD